MGINIVLLGGDKGIDTRMEGGVKVLIVNSSLAGLEQGFKKSRPFVMPGSAYWIECRDDLELGLYLKLNMMLGWQSLVFGNKWRAWIKRMWTKVRTAKGKKESIHTFLSTGWRWEGVFCEHIGNTATQSSWTKRRSHGLRPPLCAYNIVVILQMDFVLLPRSINDWTHESQCGPELVNHRPRGKNLIELLCRWGRKACL